MNKRRIVGYSSCAHCLCIIVIIIFNSKLHVHLCRAQTSVYPVIAVIKCIVSIMNWCKMMVCDSVTAEWKDLLYEEPTEHTHGGKNMQVTRRK